MSSHDDVGTGMGYPGNPDAPEQETVQLGLASGVFTTGWEVVDAAQQKMGQYSRRSHSCQVGPSQTRSLTTRKTMCFLRHWSQRAQA